VGGFANKSVGIFAQTAEQMKMQQAVRVFKTVLADQAPVRAGEAGFFPEFTGGSSFCCFSGFDFTAGKRPQAATMLLFISF